jgi:ribonuclease G
MSDELLVNVTPMETRVAIVENGMLQEVLIERASQRGLVGNIYCGKVVRVLPGMQAAFLDIGLARTCFLSIVDIEHEDITKDISELLKEGQSLIVQVIKDPISNKGARVTALLSLSSRYLVYMPDLKAVGISQRITDELVRERLKKMVQDIAAKFFPDMKGNFIIRTVAEDAVEDDIKNDISFLQKLWLSLEAKKSAEPKVPVCLYQDINLSLRVLRDVVKTNIEKIRVDSRETLQKMQDFCDDFLIDSKKLLEWYPGERPIFELYSVEDEIKRALGRRVELKSGGYLIIDQTEAMTTIDVNTGGYVGSSNLEETVFKTNLEAAATLAGQLRVRNLGGIIIVDFIDMQDEDHRQQVIRNLEKALEKDSTKITVSGITELGLVQIVRKRTRESLVHMLCENCHVCDGRGTIKSAETVCYEIFRAVMREARAYDHDAYLILASQQVIDRLLDEESANVSDLELFIGKTLRFQVEALYSQERFDVILL